MIKKSRGFKFNFFDVTVIAVVALIIIGAAYIYFLGSDSNNALVEMEYVLKIEMVDKSFEKLVEKGDNLIDIEGKKSIGKVVDVKIEGFENNSDSQTPFPTATPTDETAALLSETESIPTEEAEKNAGGYVNIFLTVQCKGQWEDGVLTVSDTRIRQGSMIEASVPKYRFKATCQSISVCGNADKGE